MTVAGKVLRPASRGAFLSVLLPLGKRFSFPLCSQDFLSLLSEPRYQSCC